MVITSEAIIKHVFVYQFLEGRFVSISKDQIVASKNKEFLKFFFKPFISEERFCFSSSSQQFGTVGQLFESAQFDLTLTDQLIKSLTDGSLPIADKSFLTLFYLEDCVIDDEVTDTVGLFLFENKEKFISLNHASDQMDLISGCSNSKIERGAWIFNSPIDEGLQSLVLDKKNDGWKKSLGLQKVKDNYFQTQTLINNVQEFAQGSFDEEASSEKISLINESMEYIKSNDFFDQSDYQEKVLQKPELIEKFESFSEEKYQKNPDLNAESFEISKPAVRKTKRFVRSVIKLDKNFHVYVHGNRENITKGFDPDKGKHFYTLFFEEEN